MIICTAMMKPATIKVFYAIATIAILLLLVYSTRAGIDADGYPYVVSTTPSDGQTGVPIHTRIFATFSEKIDPSSITTATFKVANDDGEAVGGEVSASGNTASFVPYNHLSDAETYIVTVTSGILADTGEALMRDYSWRFTTGTE